MRRLPFLLWLSVAAFAPPAVHAKKPSLSEVFGTAKTVFVEAGDARDITDLSLDQETRNAILSVQDAIDKWGRYSLSRSRRDADLILVVYKGKLLQPRKTPNAPGSPRNTTSRPAAPQIGDATQSDPGADTVDTLTQEKDVLRVYTLSPNGKLKGPLWSGEQDYGLKEPGVYLLKRLKADVEKAYPPTPAASPSNP